MNIYDKNDISHTQPLLCGDDKRRETPSNKTGDTRMQRSFPPPLHIIIMIFLSGRRAKGGKKSRNLFSAG